MYDLSVYKIIYGIFCRAYAKDSKNMTKMW